MSVEKNFNRGLRILIAGGIVFGLAGCRNYSEPSRNEPGQGDFDGFLNDEGKTFCPVVVEGDFFGDKKDIVYQDIEDGSKVLMNLNGETKEVTIRYNDPDIVRIKVRNENGEDVSRPFSNGAETTRKLGEILSPRLRKIEGRSSVLEDDVSIGVYPGPTGSYLSLEGREDLEIGPNSYAIFVATAYADTLGLNNPAPFEVNENDSDNNINSVKGFGKGSIIGSIFEDVNGNITLAVDGYLPDSRVLSLE